MEIKHKGYTIELNESKGTWTCFELSYTNESLNKLKTQIDNYLKKEKSFNPIEVYEKDYFNGYSICKITSIASEDLRDVWINTGGKRKKCNVSYLYLKNESNKLLIDKIHEVKNKISVLSEQESNLENQLQRVSAKDLKQ